MAVIPRALRRGGSGLRMAVTTKTFIGFVLFNINIVTGVPAQRMSIGIGNIFNNPIFNAKGSKKIY